MEELAEQGNMKDDADPDEDDRKEFCVQRFRWGRKTSLARSTWRGTELIPSSHYRVYTGAVSPRTLSGLKYFTWKANTTKIHLRTGMMMNTGEALQGCLRSHVEVILKRDLSCIQALFLTSSFPSTPPTKAFIFRHDCWKRRSLQTAADMKGKWMKREENPKTFKRFQVMQSYFPRVKLLFLWGHVQIFRLKLTKLFKLCHRLDLNKH